MPNFFLEKFRVLYLKFGHTDHLACIWPSESLFFVQIFPPGTSGIVEAHIMFTNSDVAPFLLFFRSKTREISQISPQNSPSRYPTVQGSCGRIPAWLARNILEEDDTRPDN